MGPWGVREESPLIWSGVPPTRWVPFVQPIDWTESAGVTEWSLAATISEEVTSKVQAAEKVVHHNSSIYFQTELPVIV